MRLTSYLLISALLISDALACAPTNRGPWRRRRPRKKTPLAIGERYPPVEETTLGASGVPEGRITAASEKYQDLKLNVNADIVFKDEEGTNEDRLMSKRCKEKLNKLAELVRQQWNGEVRLRVTEAWDKGDGHHAKDSLHYEGRAVDITTSDRDRQKYGMLARLAVIAEFDWVYYESRGHVHCSVKSDSAASIKWGGCFNNEGIVTVQGGTRKHLSDVTVGDHVLSGTADGQPVYSEVIMFMDRSLQKSTLFHQVELEDGNVLELTPSHLIFVPSEGNEDFAAAQSVFAKELTSGSRVFLTSNSTTHLSTVKSVGQVVRAGAIAPVTQSGTIVVNGVLTSCYALIKSHTIAHASLLPVRTWHYLTHLGTGSHEVTSMDSTTDVPIPTFAHALFKFAHVVLPQSLFYDP